MYTSLINEVNKTGLVTPPGGGVGSDRAPASLVFQACCSATDSATGTTVLGGLASGIVGKRCVWACQARVGLLLWQGRERGIIKRGYPMHQCIWAAGAGAGVLQRMQRISSWENRAPAKIRCMDCRKQVSGCRNAMNPSTAKAAAAPGASKNALPPGIFSRIGLPDLAESPPVA
jgi:hypothetical protein